MLDEATDSRADKPRVQTAARTVDILRYVAGQPATGVSAKQISSDLGLPRQVVYHLVHTLVETDMLRKIGGSSYVLGFGVSVLADGFRRQLTSAGMMVELAERAAHVTGETAYVVGWLDGEIVVLATARGTAAVHAGEVPQGTAGDAHARASGKMLLSMVSQAEVDRYFSKRDLRRRTKSTITDLARLKEQLAVIQGRGFSVENEEYAEGLSCVAVPIGKVPSQMVLGLSAPSERFDLNLSAYVEQLREIAKR